MPKGICADGTPIDQKVRSFQINRDNNDFYLVRKYYDDYKKYWFKKVDDLIDEDEFEQEWHSKLLHSMETYKEKKAIQICRVRGWSMQQKFNRWFYSALRNWICNIKTQAFRLKKRPGIICPVCFREVGKIEERHLQHIRTIRDFPRIFEYEGIVYKTMFQPQSQVREFFGSLKEISQSTKIKGRYVKWQWFLEDGNPVVICPYTKRKIKIIDDEYILKLPKKYRHYARPFTWFEFQETFPNYMVHSDIKSLDYRRSLSRNKDIIFAENVRTNRRILGSHFASYVCSFSKLGTLPLEYEHALRSIDKYVSDDVNKKILKCIMVGDETKDICDKLELTRQELKERINDLGENKNLEKMLIKGAFAK